MNPYRPDPLPSYRTAEPRCQRCGEHIVYVRMATSGKLMPCQMQWEYGDGRISLVVLNEALLGRLVVRAGAEVFGRQPHFGNCPADRRERERQRGARLLDQLIDDYERTHLQPKSP